MNARNAIGLGAVAMVFFLAIAPIIGAPAWITIILGLFLLLEVIALWAMARERA